MAVTLPYSNPIGSSYSHLTPERPLLTREEIAANKKLARYHLTITQSLNDEQFRAMGVHTGFKQEESAFTQALEVGGKVSGLIPVPVASQIAELAFMSAHFASGKVEDHINQVKSDKILAINPTHDPVEWKKFTEELAIKLTSEKQDEIKACEAPAKGDHFAQRIKNILYPNRTPKDSSLAVKSLAVRDCSKMIQTILNKELDENAPGIENENSRKSLVSELVSSTKAPSKHIEPEGAKTVFAFNHLVTSH
ncbi:MAG: hypothetical protein V4694_01290 [Pseudomonadota bacterium]